MFTALYAQVRDLQTIVFSCAHGLSTELGEKKGYQAARSGVDGQTLSPHGPVLSGKDQAEHQAVVFFKETGPAGRSVP